MYVWIIQIPLLIERKVSSSYIYLYLAFSSVDLDSFFSPSSQVHSGMQRKSSREDSDKNFDKKD